MFIISQKNVSSVLSSQGGAADELLINRDISPSLTITLYVQSLTDPDLNICVRQKQHGEESKPVASSVR